MYRIFEAKGMLVQILLSAYPFLFLIRTRDSTAEVNFEKRQLKKKTNNLR